MKQKRERKQRLDIQNINELEEALRGGGYNLDLSKEAAFIELANIFNLDKKEIERLRVSLIEKEIRYRSEDLEGFIEYIKKLASFEESHIRVWDKIARVKTLRIHRVEYDRIISKQDDVKDILVEIERVIADVSDEMDNEGIKELAKLEERISKDYIYTKDIELLKKIIGGKKHIVKESYNKELQINSITIKIPNNIEMDFIPVKEGSIEYHKHISNSIPRMKRLIKNLNKYMKADSKECGVFHINQSNTLQDSINMAVAIYDNKTFRAVSGSNEVNGCCKAPQNGQAVFQSHKVNKLGKLGIGYNRVNDSEKKILEEVHRQIMRGELKDEGHLVLYTKWEPCPSCYHVISQFSRVHPSISVKVKYMNKYGNGF